MPTVAPVSPDLALFFCAFLSFLAISAKLIIHLLERLGPNRRVSSHADFDGRIEIILHNVIKQHRQSHVSSSMRTSSQGWVPLTEIEILPGNVNDIAHQKKISEERCYIWLEPLSIELVSAPPCGHMAHDSCLRRWFRHIRKTDCPICPQ